MAGREIPDSGPSPGLYADALAFGAWCYCLFAFLSSGAASRFPWGNIIWKGLDKPLGSTEIHPEKE